MYHTQYEISVVSWNPETNLFSGADVYSNKNIETILYYFVICAENV